MGSFSPDLAITGAAQTGFTSPTYTLLSDLAPDSNSRQWVVSALGGTQTGVRVSTNGDPFTVTIRKDKTYKSVPARHPVTGVYSGAVPMNKIEILGRKGCYIDADNTVRNANLRIIAEVPAGAEQFDAANLRGLSSMILGLLAEEASDYGDSIISGIV
jgi:hypothetical protein